MTREAVVHPERPDWPAVRCKEAQAQGGSPRVPFSRFQTWLRLCCHILLVAQRKPLCVSRIEMRLPVKKAESSVPIKHSRGSESFQRSSLTLISGNQKRSHRVQRCQCCSQEGHTALTLLSRLPRRRMLGTGGQTFTFPMRYKISPLLCSNSHV